MIEFFLNRQGNSIYQAKLFSEIKIGGHRCPLRVKLL